MSAPIMSAKPTQAFHDLGPKSREMLRLGGISSLAQLRGMGSVAAYVMVKRAGYKPSLSFLWGIEGLVTGEDWRDVAKNHRTSLLLALDEHEHASQDMATSGSSRASKPR